MAQQSPQNLRQWTDRLSRSGYFMGALLLHLVVFMMVATWVIFPAFKPPVDDFTKTYLPPPSPPPPPPPQNQQAVQVPTHAVAPPTPLITSPTATPTFTVPMPVFDQASTPDAVTAKMTQKVSTPTNNNISNVRLAKIMETEKAWGRDSGNIRNSNGDPHNVVAKFPVYLASYANGDWGCNVGFVDGKIATGSLPNLVAKVNEWSHGNITGQVEPQPLQIGGSDLLAKRPPFIFFTGHKDFVLTDQEIQNLRDYLQVGGAIWGDNALAGQGSRFDVAFRREMKRVIPDADKNFEEVPLTDDIFTKSWFPITKLPSGMNYYEESILRINIDGKLAILYTPNDYSDMMTMHILPGDKVPGSWMHLKTDISPLVTYEIFWKNGGIFFRNYDLEHCLACDQLGMNILGFLLVRFDKDLLLTP